MGTTIFGGLGPGLGMNINPFDPDYQKKELIAKNQSQVDAQNARAAKEYTDHATQVKADNTARAALKPPVPLVAIDPPPHKLVLSADGMTVIPATDLVCDPISVMPDQPPTPTVAGQGVSFTVGQTISDANIPRIVQMLMVLYSEIESIKTDIAAIKAKLSA